MKKKSTRIVDKEKEMQEHFHLTRPPRLDGKAKNAMMLSKRKKKKAEKE